MSKQFHYSSSLRLKVTLGITIPMILMLGGFIYFEYTSHRAMLLDNLSSLASYNGKVVEQALRPSMLKADFVELQNTLDAIGKVKNLSVLYLMNTTGQVIFAPNQSGAGKQLDYKSPTCQACHKLNPGRRPSGVVVTAASGTRVFRSMLPIQNETACTTCHDPQQRLIGLLLIDIPVGPFEAAITADLQQNLGWGLATILVSALIANFVMGRLVIDRLGKVAGALKDFGRGEHNRRLVSGSTDEIGQLERDFNQMGQRIQAEEAENQALSDDLRQQSIHQQVLLKRLITAQEDERKRVARELHDDLGQSLSGLALNSELLEKFIPSDPERALRQLSLTRELISGTTQKMYDLILALRPSVLDDMGLAAALKSHAALVLTGCNITFQLDASGLARRLPPEVEVTLYRVFQEALTNVVKHAEATQVKITLTCRDEVFEGEFEDNGRGFSLEEVHQESTSPRGLGLLGMQERLAQVSGSMQILSGEGTGTRLHFTVPLRKNYE